MTKKTWPTKDAMAQIYENNLWGGDKSEYYSGLGSHQPETVNPYIAVVSDFLKDFGRLCAARGGKVFGNQNSNNHKTNFTKPTGRQCRVLKRFTNDF